MHGPEGFGHLAAVVPTPRPVGRVPNRIGIGQHQLDRCSIHYFRLGIRRSEEYKNSQQREAAFGGLTRKTVNDQLHQRIMKIQVTHIIALLVLALGLVLFATGCGPL
jgi:hypothetical protein